MAVWPRRVVLVLSALNFIGAAAGAWGLITGVLDLGPTVTGRLPWGSAVVAGVALAALVALPNLVLFALALQRKPSWPRVGIAVGLAMVGWIVVQLAFIRDLTFFHPLYVGIGAIVAWAGWAARSASDQSESAVSTP